MNTQQIDSKFEALLDYLKRSRGFDFTGYKRASLMRRVSKRMQVVGSEDFQSYIDYLEVHPEEFTLLFNTILINVTSFFRDLPAWEYLSTEIVPRLLEGKLTTEPIRIWCAGCASGEEAYTVSMMMAEALGESFFRERVKIYATDLDEEALLKARSASYTSKDVEGVPADLLKRYFDPNGNRFVFRGDLRREVIFGRHDLLHDAPISRIDLLVCRNILMYFNADIQARVLGRMHFSLRKGGFLFLGKAEMLLTDSNLYLPIDIKHRIFKKVAKDAMQDRMVVMAQAAGGGGKGLALTLS